MMTRRITAPMLYGQNTSTRWLLALASAIDHAAAALCCRQWQDGLIPCLQPARMVRIARTRMR